MPSDIPANMVVVTASIRHETGNVSDEYTTSITVQTHKHDEIERAVDLAWTKTRTQINKDQANEDQSSSDVHGDGKSCV